VKLHQWVACEWSVDHCLSQLSTHDHNGVDDPRRVVEGLELRAAVTDTTYVRSRDVQSVQVVASRLRPDAPSDTDRSSGNIAAGAVRTPATAMAARAELVTSLQRCTAAFQSAGVVLVPVAHVGVDGNGSAE
jgi:hypothetical protein